MQYTWNYSLDRERERERVFAKNTNTMLSYNTRQCRRATEKAIAYQRWPPIVTISNQ